MPDTDVFRLQKSDLNSFLFADVGTESNGMPLSVVSMLGRLARQTPEAATRELAEIITGTACSGRSSAEVMAIATRLAALLPTTSSRRAERQAARSVPPGPVGVRNLTTTLTWGAIILGVMVLAARMLGLV
ncbi:MAG TPA: hypothetical protein VK597_06720 [Inquilinus sp.]|nr:hypothetical protein [Inquilinus sp.]